LELDDLKLIEVNPGPGSYTGVRVGVAVANALSWALNLKINNEKKGELVYPVY
jgi:tRNA A37 threonylcarbamoyladenosine modification protein TsaB